jgi:hypothetical protein
LCQKGIKTHLRASEIWKNFPGVIPPDPRYKGEGKEEGRERKGRKRREGEGRGGEGRGGERIKGREGRARREGIEGRGEVPLA